MFLIVSIAFLIIIRLLFARAMPWRPVSVTTFNLAGVLLFVVLGVALEGYGDPTLNMLILVGFYLSLVVGEFMACGVVLDKRGFGVLGKNLFDNHSVRVVLFGVFFLFSLLPWINIFASGTSPLALYLKTWANNGVEERSQRLIEYYYLQSTVSGIRALVVALQRQMMGFWYLSIGVVAVWRYRVALIVLVINTCATFLLSGGARSGGMISIGVFALVWLLSQKRRHLMTYLFIILLFIASLLILDALLQGRSGREATGTLFDRVERTLEADFAYGGIGLRLGAFARQATLETAFDYIVRLVTLPVPRSLYPSKSIVDPNWEMTEAYHGASLSRLGSITLFTPLGEALYYFGYPGIIVIPFLYGFTTRMLERLYLTSPTYRGLLAQVYVWSFLGMRHTYWNLFSALIVVNLVMLCMLLLGKWRMMKYPMQHHLYRSVSDARTSTYSRDI